MTVAGDRIGVDADSARPRADRRAGRSRRAGDLRLGGERLGPDGRPAPRDESVTGGQGAGQVASVSRYEAVLRAAKARGTEGPPAYWLVDDTTREVLAGPQASRDALTGGGSAPEGARVAEVPGGVRVVQAERMGPGGWYALDDSAALGNADVARARAARDPATQEPAAAFAFTPAGQQAFSELTREIAQRGADSSGRARSRSARRSTWRSCSTTGWSPCRSSTSRRPRTGSTDGPARRSRAASPGSARSRSRSCLNTGPMPVALEPQSP